MNLFSRLLPTPSFVTMPTVGLDFSDATLRFVSLETNHKGLFPKYFEQFIIPEGCMKDGRIVDPERFIVFLKDIKKDHKLRYARVSIPESQVYSFTALLDIGAKNDVRGAIELLIEDNIPLKALETIFDYHILSITEKNIVVQVMALSEAVSSSYFNAFVSSGIIPVSFELEGQAIVRSVLDPKDIGSYMIVDFGANRTSINIVTNQTVMLTSTLDFGGSMLSKMLAKELSISLADADILKREHGLSTIEGINQNVFPIIANGISVLKDEINRRYIYWQENKDQFGTFPNISTIYLCGGHSNLYGLDEYLSSSLKLRVLQVNPWRNCFSLEDDIPSMSHEVSMSYVTAIGLALADFVYD